MSLASGVGSHPGDDQRDFDEAVRIVLGEVPDLAYLPEVPGRGAHADMVGRTAGLLSGLAADLQPAGWRLPTRPGSTSAGRGRCWPRTSTGGRSRPRATPGR